MIGILSRYRYAILISSCLVSCAKLAPEPPAPYEVVVAVTSDPDKPLKGAEVQHDGAKVAATGADGKAALKLRGNEGEAFVFGVKCPAGYQSPSKPVTITLRRLADPKRHPEYQVSCPPQTRTIVVAVRADNGPNLPVMFLGRELGRTDSAGAANVMLELKPDEQFQLMLKTEGDSGLALRPQNPVATFTVKSQDDIVTFDQRFIEDKKKAVYRGGPRGPQRLPIR